MPTKPVKLKYIGNGDNLDGVPAADHEAPSTEEAKVRIASGLYEEVAERKTRDKDDDDK